MQALNSGKNPSSVSHAAPGSPVAALSKSASEVTKLNSSVAAIGDAAVARQFLDAQLAAFEGFAAPGGDLPTLTASITAEIEKIRGLVQGNTRGETTLTSELTFLDTLGTQSAAKRKLNADHGNLAALIHPNGQLEVALDAYFQDKDAPAHLAWMHAAATAILQAASPAPLNVVAAPVNLADVAAAVKALREFDGAFQALRVSVPDAPDADGGPDRYSAFVEARQAALDGGVDFTARLNQAVTSLISRCDADEAGIRALISISNDPTAPGVGGNVFGEINTSAGDKLKQFIPRLSAAHVVVLYGALRGATGPLNQGTIRGALANRLTVLGEAAMALVDISDVNAILRFAGEWGGFFDAIGVEEGRSPDLGALALLTALVGDSDDAEALIVLYRQVHDAAPALSRAITVAVAARLTVLGTEAVTGAGAGGGGLADVRRAYTVHFRAIGMDKPDLGDDVAILGLVNTRLAALDLTMASIMTYYADETPGLLGPLHHEALVLIEAKLGTLAGAAPDRLAVAGFVQLVNHLRDFHVALSSGDDAAATVKMNALSGQITPFLPADMTLADIAGIHDEITNAADKVLLSAPLGAAVSAHFVRTVVQIGAFTGLVVECRETLRTLGVAADSLPIGAKLRPLVADMDTTGALLEAHGDLGDLGDDPAVKAVLTSRLSALAQAVEVNEAAAYIAFVNDFHAAYTAIAPDEFADLCRAKLPDGLTAAQIQDVYAGINGDAPKAVVRPILLDRVLALATDDRGALLHIVQTYVPVLVEGLRLPRGEALTQLTGILHSRLSDNPAGLAAQFGQLGEGQAALRVLFLATLMQQAQVLPARMDNAYLQAHIVSFLDAIPTISGDELDRYHDLVLTALMTTIAGNLTPEACVALYTYLVRADGGMGDDIPNALREPLAQRVWEQVIDNGTAADFAGSVNRLREQLTALNYGGDDLARAMQAKNIATLLPAHLTPEDIKAIYRGLDAAADKDAVRGALVTQSVALYNALPEAQTAQSFIDCVNQLVADLGVLEVQVQAIPAACAGINVASKLPPETVAMTPANVDGIIAALAPLGVNQGTPGVYPHLIKAIELYLGRGRADVDASLATLRALGHPEADAKVIIINNLPFTECLKASGLVSTPALQAAFLTTANSFLSNPDNLKDENLLTLLPRMGKLLGDKVAEIKCSPAIDSAVHVRVLDTLATMKYPGAADSLQAFRLELISVFRRVSLALSKPGIVRHSGHTVLDFQAASVGDSVPEVFVEGVHNYDAQAVTTFLEMAQGLAHIEDTEVQIGLLAELKHLVTKMTQGKSGRAFTGAQLKTLMSIMDTSAHAIPAAAAADAAALKPADAAALKPADAAAAAAAATIRGDFLETMRLLGSEKTLNEAPKKDRPELRRRHSEIMMALAQGGSGEATVEATSEDSDSVPDSSRSPKPKGILPLSSISPADTARLVSIYRGQLSGAVTASEKFRPIVALADRLKAAVNSKDNAQHKEVIELLIPMIDAAFKDNDVDTALQLVPFLRPLMDLKVTHNDSEVSIAAVYGTRIATLLGSCASQPNAALKAEVVKAATDLALLTKDYPSKSWERARRVLTLGLAHPLKLRGSSAGTTCGELSVMLLAKLAKDKSSVVEKAAKDGLFQLYSSDPAMMGLGDADGNNMRHMVKIGMKDAGLGSSPSSFMPNGAIRVGTDENKAKQSVLAGVRDLMAQKSDSDLVDRFGDTLGTLRDSLELRPRAVAMMLDAVTKRVMTDDKREGKAVVALLGFVGGIASSPAQGVTYASRERLMALQTLRVLYPLMDTGVQIGIKTIFKEIMQDKVPATGAAEFAQLRSQAAEALAWMGVPAGEAVKSRGEVSELYSSGGVAGGSSTPFLSSLDSGPVVSTSSTSSTLRESPSTEKAESTLHTLHEGIAAGNEGGPILSDITTAVNAKLRSKGAPDFVSISQHLDLLAFWMSSYPELATSNDVRDFLLRVSTSGLALVQFKVVPLLGQFAALCTDSGNVVVKRLQVLATTGLDQSVKDAATATCLKLLAGPAEANDAMRSVLKKQFGDKDARNEETLAGIRAVVHAFRTDVTSTLQGMTLTQKLVAIDEVVLSYHKNHSSAVAVVTALGDFLSNGSSEDGASLPAARALMNLYPFLTDDQKSVVYVSLATSMGTNSEVKAFIRSKGADRVRFIAEEARQVDAASSSRSASPNTNKLILFLGPDHNSDARNAALAALVVRFKEGVPSKESLEIFNAVQQRVSSSSSAGVFGSLSKKTDPFQVALAALEAHIQDAISKGSVDLAAQYLQVGYSDTVRLAAARHLIPADSAAVSGASGGAGKATEAAPAAESSPKAAIMEILSPYKDVPLFKALFKDLKFQIPAPPAKAVFVSGGQRGGSAISMSSRAAVGASISESRWSKLLAMTASPGADETPLGRSSRGGSRVPVLGRGAKSGKLSQVVSPGSPPLSLSNDGASASDSESPAGDGNGSESD